MKVVSSQVAFIDGKRVRPGVPFEIPDGHTLGAGMRMVDAGQPAKKVGGQGDTKPADAAAAAVAKQSQDDSADTKPGDAKVAAAKKVGGQG